MDVEGYRSRLWCCPLLGLSENTLGPLKSTLIKNLDINNSQVRFGSQGLA